MILEKHKIELFLTLLLFTLQISGQNLVHPGISHKKSDLDRMKIMVAAQVEPYYSAYNNLKSNTLAKYDYSVGGRDTCRIIIQDGVNFAAFRNDSKAAYLNALLWAITGDERHAQKCVEIFNAWCNLTCFQGGGTESLNAGRVGWQIIEAAEIIKSTYSGWTAVDIQRFKDMLVYPGYSNTRKPSSVTTNNGTFYWRVYQGDALRHGNQDMFGWRVVMAMGIFLDNQIMFDRAYRYFTKQTHRTDDIAYESGPPRQAAKTAETEWLISYGIPTLQKTTPDYGYNGVLDYFILETGQSQESARDQDHATLGVGVVASMAEIAWNQGYDIYSMYNSRILKGYEWAMRYNVSYKQSYPDQTSPWEPVQEIDFIPFLDRTTRWYSLKVSPYNEAGDVNAISRGAFLDKKERPIYEMALAHYNVRVGLPADSTKWTQRALDLSGLETLGPGAGVWHDHLGWGGLSFHRTAWMAGDPVSFASGQSAFALPQIPCTINAVDFDEYVGNGQNHTFFDNTPGNAGNVYRPNTDVDIKSGGDDTFVIYSIEEGEWTAYTFGVPSTGDYDIFIRHKTAEEGAKIKIAIDNMEYDESILPQTAGFEETKVTSVHLSAGVKVMRVFHTGESHATEFSNLQLAKAQTLTSLNYTFTTDAENWTVTDVNSSYSINDGHLNCTMGLQSNSKYRGDMKYNNGANSTLDLILDPAKDVYLAVKFIGDRPNGAMKMEMQTIAGGWYNQQWNSGNPDGSLTTSENNKIYYFRLTKDAGYLAQTNGVAIRKINIILADAAVEPYSYSVDWIATFASLADLEEYKNTKDDGANDVDKDEDTPTAIFIPETNNIFRYYSENGILHIESNRTQQINIFAIDGRMIKTLQIVSGENQIALPKGIYIIEKQKVIVY
jgi:hypothetical protein